MIIIFSNVFYGCSLRRIFKVEFTINVLKAIQLRKVENWSKDLRLKMMKER
jgi:hypothetical protein